MEKMEQSIEKLTGENNNYKENLLKYDTNLEI